MGAKATFVPIVASFVHSARASMEQEEDTQPVKKVACLSLWWNNNRFIEENL